MPPSPKRTLAAAAPTPARVTTSKTAAAITSGKPTIVAVVLSVLATALQIVNQTVLTAGSAWQIGITVVLVFLAGEAIRPLTPGGFENLIHIPEWLATILTAVSTALALALQIAHISQAAHVIVLAVVTFLVALGFGGSAESVPVTVGVTR